MNDTLHEVRTYLKRGLAAVVFIIMLLGGSAAALSGFAAAINALSGVYGERPVLPSQTTVSTAQGATGQSTSSVPRAGVGEATPQSGQPTDAADGGPPAVVSPVENSLDHGGMALSERVHETFGHILSGVLGALFLDQGDTATSGGQE